MKFLISVTIIAAVCFGIWKISEMWNETQQQREDSMRKTTAAATATRVQTSGEELPGLPPQLQGAYTAAQQRGAPGLREFLAAHAKEIQDPRLAWIQLDYVLLEAPTDLADARREFAKVKARVLPGSPVYSRVQQMEATYQPPDR